MAKRIAGITIEIGGDTTKLQTALKGIDTQVGVTQRTLRDVDKLLKFNPGNVELLTQKQKYLGQEIDATKERLKQLKSVQTDSLSPEQYDALQREIAETESKLQNLEDKYKSFGSVAGQQLQVIGDKVKDVGGKISGIGEGLTKYVTVPIAGVASASVVAWKEIDTALDTVTKKTGATGDTLTDMHNRTKHLAETIPTSFQTAGEAVGEVNTRFGLFGDELEDLSGKFIKFADLNDTDVSSSIDSVQKALDAYGLTAEDAGGMLDVLNTVGQNTGISVDKLSESLVKNAPALKQMGFSASDSAIFLGELEASGVDSSTVMTGLKKALSTAAKEGKPMDQAMQDIQKSIMGAGDETEATQRAIELFGTRAGPAIADAVRNGQISFDHFGTDLSDFAGNVESTFNETLSPLDEMTTTLNTVKDIGAEIVNASAPMITKAMSVIRDVVDNLKEKWDGLSEGQQESIIKAAMVAAAAGPVISAIGGLTTGVGGLITHVGKLIGKGPEIMSAFSSVSGFITGTVLPGITGIGSAIGGTVVPAISGAIAFITGTAVPAIGGALATVATFITGTAIPAIASFAVAAAPFLIGGAIIAGAVAAGVLIVKNWDEVKETAGKLRDAVVKAWNDLTTKVSTAVTNLKTAVTDKWNGIKTNVSNTVNAVNTTVTNIWNGIKTNVTNAVTAVKTKVTNVWNAIKTTTTNVWNAVKSAVTNPINAAKGAVNSAVGAIKSKVDSGFGAVRTKITDVMNKAKDAVSSAIKTIKSKFKFSWSLPKLKLPHPKISGKFSLNPPSVPKFSISWYRKAYDNAMLFRTPTVLPTAAGLKGFGDGPGGEVVLSEAKLRQLVGAGRGDTTQNINITINTQPGQSAKQIANEVQRILVQQERQREAALG